MKSNEMWQRYAGDHADQITYEAWAFCGGGKVGDELAELVLAGVKTATASAYVSYQAFSSSMVYHLQAAPNAHYGCFPLS